ncbi:hypothetical protein B5X24_HaOG205589 [Helicoverpa armigera]|uniref:Uncharacterized protein n=1 Tax=Helicoverpa armigera TaxID=29058 RepID=A0A2W1BQI2_HELAM|nr:hypothetical protein B5X24_HaOG205589 [Helicoverpa armigera]
MASPLPLQLADSVGYVDDLGSLTDYLISDAIPQRNAKHSPFHSPLSDFKLVDQPYRQCPVSSPNIVDPTVPKDESLQSVRPTCHDLRLAFLV